MTFQALKKREKSASSPETTTSVTTAKNYRRINSSSIEDSNFREI
jgi:hypothetical protein